MRIIEDSDSEDVSQEVYQAEEEEEIRCDEEVEKYSQDYEEEEEENQKIEKRKGPIKSSSQAGVSSPFKYVRDGLLKRRRKRIVDEDDDDDYEPEVRGGRVSVLATPEKTARPATPEKKMRAISTDREVKTPQPTPTKSDGDKKEKTGTRKIAAPTFDDKDLDVNLFHENPLNLKKRKVMISSNIILISQMIDAGQLDAKGLFNNYAAMTIHKKMKDGKAFEFHIPLQLIPTMIKGMNYLVENNKDFFQNRSCPM